MKNVNIETSYNGANIEVHLIELDRRLSIPLKLSKQQIVERMADEIDKAYREGASTLSEVVEREMAEMKAYKDFIKDERSEKLGGRS